MLQYMSQYVYAPDIPTERKNAAFEDSDLSFGLIVESGNLAKAEWCLNNVRDNFPGSRIFLVSDGNDTYKPLAEKLGIEYYNEGRLMPISNGALYLHKRLEFFLKNPTKYFIKIEDDTGIHRRFEYVPDYEIFGTLIGGGPYGIKCVHGGCICCSLEAAKDLYDSQVFLDPNLRIVPWIMDPALNYQGPPLLEEALAFGEGCNHRELTFGPFPEVRCGNEYTHNTRKRVAVTHPCKDMLL